jgi:hypothetical protein
MTKQQRELGRHSIKWIRAYLECLFENRPVAVLAQHVKPLQLLLW